MHSKNERDARAYIVLREVLVLCSIVFFHMQRVPDLLSSLFKKDEPHHTRSCLPLSMTQYPLMFYVFLLES